jgi:predicted outer membrane repeat protein
LLAVSLPAFSLQQASAAGVVGNGNPASCTETALNNALMGGGLVTFNCGPAGHTILLTTTKVIANDTQIDGAGLISLDMGDNDRHFYVAPPVTLELSGIDLEGGASASHGGAIWNDGTLITTDVAFVANQATGNGGAIRNDGTLSVFDGDFLANLADGNGGAIYNSATGTMTVTNETLFLGNRADVPSDGGAIFNDGGTVQVSNLVTFDTNGGVDGGAIANASFGTLTVDGVRFLSNVGSDNGGAIANLAGFVTISGSRFFDNLAISDDGGAIYNAIGGGSVNVERSEFASNDAGNQGGAFWNGRTLNLTDVGIYENTSDDSGGGIYNDPAGNVAITRSSLHGNQADVQGGGLYNGALATIQTSTISTNFAINEGGGIMSQAGAVTTIVDSTIAFNDSGLPGGGIRNAPASTINVGNSIIAENPSGDCSNLGVVISNNFNLDSDGSCPLPLPADINGGNANLQPIDFNGGLTVNHLPGPASDAIDAGPATCASPDQRGGTRPRNGVCDIGAIEVVPAPDVCYNPSTRRLVAPNGASCPGGHPAIVFQEFGPHYLCTNPSTGALSLSAGPLCPPSNTPAIQMPAEGPLAVCMNLSTRHYRLPKPAFGCTANEALAILS